MFPGFLTNSQRVQISILISLHCRHSQVELLTVPYVYAAVIKSFNRTHSIVNRSISMNFIETVINQDLPKRPKLVFHNAVLEETLDEILVITIMM